MNASPFLGLPGAVAADAPDAGVPEHYGDPLGEQRRAATGVAVVDRSHRSVVAVTGEDRLTFLHNLTSQRFQGISAPASGETLLLSPQGKLEHHALFIDDGESTWLDVEPGVAADLVQFLESMRFIMRVDIADRTSDFAVVTVLGPATADAVLTLASAELRPSPYGVTSVEGGGFVRRMPWPTEVAADLVVRRGELARLASSGVAVAGVGAFEALRIAAGRPREGLDTDNRTLPHEMGWVGGAVALDKGCYRGQESVAHVQNLGRPPRRLVLLHLDGSTEALPARGTPLRLDERDVGTVTSSAQHFELGPIALGLLAYKTPDGATLRLDIEGAAVNAAVEAVVAFDDAPRPGQVARQQLRMRMAGQ